MEEDEPDEIVTVTNPQISGPQIAHDATLEEVPSQFIDVGPRSKLKLKNTLVACFNQAFLGVFDIVVQKNFGLHLFFQQFYALLLKRIINSLRNYLVLFSALLPFLFVIISLIIEQQIPKPGDSPSLLMSLDRYEESHVPYTYDSLSNTTVDFIRSYESYLQQLPKAPNLIDLTKNNSRPCQDGTSTDVITYLACIGQRSLLDLSDRYHIGASVKMNSTQNVLSIIAHFNNQPYHVPSLTLNTITNALLKQYSSPAMSNSSIYVTNHPVSS